MRTIIRKWLQVQPTRGPTIDRSLTYVVGSTTEAEFRRLRGTKFRVGSKFEATRLHKEIHRLAKEAVAEGRVPEFLDGLDQRARSSAEPGPTFKDFAKEWFETCVKGGGLRESQIESDESILKNHLVPFFGRKYLRDIGPADIDRYKATKLREKHQFGRGFSAKTIRNQQGVLHRICEKAIEYGHIDKNPISKRSWMKSDKTPEESRAWWTPEEQVLVFKVLSAWLVTCPEVALPILVQLVTGIRFGELRALEKRDLDLRAPGLWIRRSQARTRVTTPKGKKARFQVLPRELAEQLHRWMLTTEGQLLFPSRTGRPLPNNTLNRAYTRLAEEAGVRRISSHGARHSSGSSYAVMGAGQKMIATLLGHADTSATERYTHVQVDATRDIVEARWARLVDPEGP